MDADRRKELQELIWSGGRWLVYFMLGAAALWFVGSLLFGLGQGKPETASKILERAAQNDSGSYIMEYQVLRRVTYGDDEQQSGFHANVQMDRSHKAYVMDLAGATLDGDPLHVQHSKGMTIYSTASFGDRWIEAPDLKPEQMTRFMPAELQSMKPELLRDTGEYRSIKSWVLRVTPTGEQLADMIWANQLNMTGSTASKEEKALRDGDYELDWAYVWVSYKSERILSIDVKFKIDKGAQYRMRIKYGAWGTVDLKKLHFKENKTLLVDTGGSGTGGETGGSSSGSTSQPTTDPTDPDAIDRQEGD
jgi:hypothetical protein